MATRRGNLTLLAFVVAALVGVALLAFPQSPLHREIKLGLDLQGGVELVLRAIPPKNEEITDENMDLAIEVIRNRVDALGVSEPEIRQQGADQISIQLPGVDDPEKASELIGKTAQLGLYDVNENTLDPTRDENGFPVPSANKFQLLKELQPRTKRGEIPEYYLVDPKAKKVISGPEETQDRIRQAYQDAHREGDPEELPGSGGSRRRRSSSPAASASATARASDGAAARRTTSTSSGTTR